MITTELGAFRILSELGSGGMGSVYLAEAPEGISDVAPGQRVALKVVHPHLLATPGIYQRFMLEARLGQRVRHVNVVRTFAVDAIVHDGNPYHYMVMEFVEGKSLRELLTDLETVPETLLREIACQAATGLAAIHAEGVVHRDLKPENLLITKESQQIRIMDLGVAKLQEATIAITMEGQFAGTLLYAAPEQFMFGEVTHAADLYSLGVLLYELATGKNPFRRDLPGAVIEAHMNFQPPLVMDINNDISRFLSECVAVLLAKAPEDRFASADELSAVFEQGERSAWWAERQATIDVRAIPFPKIRVRRETRLIGRERELRTLRDAWERAQAGEGNALLLEGEAGIGKTRLVDAFLHELRDPEVEVLYGAYPPSGGLDGITNAIVGRFGEVGLADKLAGYLAVTPSLVPAFAALLNHESPPPGSEPLQGDALLAVCVHLMRALAAERPLIWVVENLDFAARENRDIALALARGLEGHRVLLVLTARPGVPTEEVAHFSRLPNFDRVELSRLGARDVMELLEDAFKSEALAEKLVGKIARKSDGVPFFVFEMIRSLMEGEYLRQLADGSFVQTRIIDAIEVPSAIKDLIQGRMLGLDDDQRAILDVGAVVGMSFEPALVAEVLGEKRIKVLRELAGIERRHGLVRGEAGRTHFDQNQIQEVLYQDLTPDLRAEYHTLLAEAYAERCGDERRGEDELFLASHHLRGSQPGLAHTHVEPALDFLQRSYRNEALLEVADRALAVPALLDDSERTRVLLHRAGRLDFLGRRDEQRETLQEAIDLADATGDAALRGSTRRAMGGLHHALSEYEPGLTIVGEALELARESGDRTLEGRATGNLGTLCLFMGRYEEAQDYLERSRDICRQLGDGRGEAVAHGTLGVVFRDLGRVDAAREEMELHRSLSHDLGHKRGEANATGNIGLLYLDQGHFEQAREHFERHRDLSRAVGNRHGEAVATGNLGSVYRDLGQYAEALAHFERHRALTRELGNRRSEAISAMNVGLVLRELGRFEEARESFDHHRRINRDLGNAQGGVVALVCLGRTLRDLGRMDDAREHFEVALARARELGIKDLESQSLLALGRFAARRGDVAEAREQIDRALALARETGSAATIVAAAVERAHLPDGDRDAALKAAREHEEHIGHIPRMEMRRRLWELTGDPAHLDEATRLLEHLIKHAPKDDRDSMAVQVELYREIRAASPG